MTAKVPSPVREADIMSLPLSTMEGFVLSRIDGTASVDDIAMMTGVPTQQLVLILDRLAELGAVTLSWKPPPQRQTAQTVQAENAAAAKAPGPRLRPPSPRYDLRLLDEAVDISRDVRKRILDYFFVLESYNYYQLLGVSVRADKKEIRSAYFELSRFFHPDSQFGKRLGSYQQRMEAVFKRLTEAYEVLGKAKRRAEYDEYIEVAVQTERVSQRLDEGARRVPTLRDLKIDIPPEPEPVARPAVRPPPSPVARAAPSLRPPPSEQSRKAAARERLTRRLSSDGKSVPPPPSAPAAPPPVSDSPRERRDSVIKGLARSLKDVANVTGGPSRIAQHLDEAAAAERRGDFLGAANAMQLALAIEPDDAELLRKYAEVSKLVARSLADNYEKQARYEEKSGKWESAARSWMRVCDGRPEDVDAARHAAEMLLKSGGDLHRAQRYAQLAAESAPNALENLTLLARVYLAAGLKLNARRELEKAVKLDPKDEMVKNLLKEAR